MASNNCPFGLRLAQEKLPSDEINAPSHEGHRSAPASSYRSVRCTLYHRFYIACLAEETGTLSDP